MKHVVSCLRFLLWCNSQRKATFLLFVLVIAIPIAEAGEAGQRCV